MPLFFRRPDGDLVKDESPLRAVLPYVMRGRNESAVYHEDTYDITKARKWLREINKDRQGPPVGLFHLVIWAVARGIHERELINRFVMSGELYRRHGVFITFAAKRQMRDDAPLVALKLPFERHEPFESSVTRINAAVMGGKSGEEQDVDKELSLFMKLPRFLRGPVMGFLQWLDRQNLMPGFMIRNDPLYTSAFIANLGSVGLDNSFHHLYEVGTCSLFIVIGTPRRETVLDRHGKPQSRDVVQLRYTLDERVADGFYAGASLRNFKRVIEDPERYIGPASAAAEPLAAAAPAPRPALPPPASLDDIPRSTP